MLLADPLASASRFAAMAARKLTRDGKHGGGSGSGIELHALLQVSPSMQPNFLAFSTDMMARHT